MRQIFLRRMLALTWTFISLSFALNLFPSLHAAPQYSITTAVVGSGTVNRNPSFDNYPANSVVTLTAVPASGWQFSHWTGDLSGSENPVNVSMSGPRSVTAHFTAISSYTLTTSVVGDGSVSLDPTGGSYLAGTAVTATATASNGWVFVNWSGDVVGSANPLSITVESNKNIIANFAELPVIEQGPQNIITNSGSTASFEVIARGTAPLGYHWEFSGEALPNEASPTLTLTNLQSLQEGTYTVTVTNAYGSASASATLQLTDSGCDGTNVVSSPNESELRAAIELGGYVRLCFNGTITLTQSITITKDVILDATARNVVISGNNATRLFVVETNVIFALTNLTLTEGKHVGEDHNEGGRPGFGGAIWNHGGTAILTSCVLTSNSAIGGNASGTLETIRGGTATGGAIFNQHGSIRIFSSLISSNVASGGSGNATFVGVPSGDALGGAIASESGSVWISDSQLNENLVFTKVGRLPSIGAAGGALFFNNTVTIVTNSILSGNCARGIDGDAFRGDPQPGYGGAIGTLRGRLEIHRSKVVGNIATSGAVFSFRPAAPGAGGALYSEGPVLLYSSTVASNITTGGLSRAGGAEARGGAWYNNSQSAASECLFYANTAQGGFSARMEFPSGTALGGAIHNSKILALTNCTFAFNLATSSFANSQNPPGAAEGGAIYNEAGGAMLTGLNLTVASNALFGAGFSMRGANIGNSNGVVTLRNSIVAYPDGTNSNVQGPITDGGHNISSDGSANFTSGTSFNFTDPRLEPLADNGGPTWTMALMPDSPAIDFGDSAGAPSIDQRGITRPSGTSVDIGAYEYMANSAPRLEIVIAQNSQIRVSFRAVPEFDYEIQASTDLRSWSTVETIQDSSTTIVREYSISGSAQFFRVLAR